MNQNKLITRLQDIVILLFVVGLLVFIPVLVFMAVGFTWMMAVVNLKYALPQLFVLVGGFLINYYWLVPRYIFHERSSKKFIFYCMGSYGLLTLGSRQLGYFIYDEIRDQITELGVEIFLATHFINFLLNTLLVLTTFFLRYRQHTRYLEQQAIEKEKEAAQNELLRLKGQLNPHFLFNTLNNISSLSAFDPDATQEAISRLSEMLRYVLYDSSTEKVPLHKDIEFMHNYVCLMQIRYEDTLKLDVQLQVSNPDRMVPPMLFISLLENAYKYGASSLHDCRLTVRMGDEDGALRFFIENTLLSEQEMASKKRGGVGLVNLEKRLQLMYPDQYTFTHGEADGCYRAEIIIKDNAES